MTSLDDLYNVFHTIKDERLDKIKLDIEDDILPLFNNPEESKDSRGDIWQYWFNGKIGDIDPRAQRDYEEGLFAINYNPDIGELNMNSTKQNLDIGIKKIHDSFMNDIGNSDRNFKYTKDTLRLLFESEKASISAIVMQTDPELNNLMNEFLIKILLIVKEGITICKNIDQKCKLEISEENYSLVDLLNQGMPLKRKELNRDNLPTYVSPGSFIVTEETLTAVGIKELNFREKVQLMNCFWNCTSHPLDMGDNKNSHIYGKVSTEKCGYAFLKLKTKTKSAPPLNMIYEKIEKNRTLIPNLTHYTNISYFMEKIKIFSTQFNKVKHLRNNTNNIDLPSGRYPLCFDFNESKKNWNSVKINLEDVENKQNIFDIKITDDFLGNIEDRVKTVYPRKSKSNLKNIRLSDREKEYMLKYKSDDKQYTQEVKDGVIYWSTGFSGVKLNTEGVLRFNMLKELEIDANNRGDRAAGVDKLQKDKFKYIRSGLSGSTWKYLQLAYFCGIKDLDKIYHIAIAYLVGCYHHSWYEVTESALDFKNEIYETDADSEKKLYSDKLTNHKFTINESYWVLDGSSQVKNRTAVNSNLSLSNETKTFLAKNIFGPSDSGMRDYQSNINYLHFYRKFLYPLLPLSRNMGNVTNYLAKYTDPSNSGRHQRTKRVLSKGGRRRRTRKQKSKFPYISTGGSLI